MLITPKAGETWRHYKHNPIEPNSYTYTIVGVGLDTESDKLVIVYKPLYTMAQDLAERGVQVFVRELDVFMAEVEVNGIKRARFEKVV